MLLQCVMQTLPIRGNNGIQGVARVPLAKCVCFQRKYLHKNITVVHAYTGCIAIKALREKVTMERMVDFPSDFSLDYCSATYTTSTLLQSYTQKVEPLKLGYVVFFEIGSGTVSGKSESLIRTLG